MENVVQKIKTFKDEFQTSMRNVAQKFWNFKNDFPTLMKNGILQIKTLQVEFPRIKSLKEWEKITLILVPYLIGCIAVGICIGTQGERTIGLKDGLILPLEFGTELIKLAIRGICNVLLILLEVLDCINDGFTWKSCSLLLSSKPPNIYLTLEVIFSWIYLSIIGLLGVSVLQERYRKMSRKTGGIKGSGMTTAGRARKLLANATIAAKKYKKPILLTAAIVVIYMICSIFICSQRDCSKLDYALAPLSSVLLVIGQILRGIVAGLIWILGCPPAPTNPKPLDLPKIEIPSVKVPTIKTPDLSKIEVPIPQLPSSSKSWSGWITSKGSNWVPNYGSGSSWKVKWPSSKALTGWIPKASSVGSKTVVSIPTVKLREVQPPKLYVPTVVTKKVSLNSVFSRLIPVLLLVIPLLCLVAYFLVQCIMMISAKYKRQRTALNINQDGKWEYGASNKKLKLQMNN